MKTKWIVASIVTLFLFPALGWLILSFFQDNALDIILRGEVHLAIQIFLGALVGILGGFGLVAVLQQAWMQPVVDKYALLVHHLQLTPTGVLFISFAAGFGEEMLFRGALQPLLGIWFTSIIFVGIHGYLNPFNWRIAIYGLIMTLIIAGLGWLTDRIGIFTACVAHMFIDIILFRFLMNIPHRITSSSHDE